MTVLLPASAARRIGTNTVVATSADTGGRYSLYRIDLPARSPGAQPHFHTRFAESFHVLSGEVSLYDGTSWVRGGERDHLFVPQRGVHGFRNDADAPAALLMMSTPGVAREDYFAELLDARGQDLTAEQWTALYARDDQVMVPEQG